MTIYTFPAYHDVYYAIYFDTPIPEQHQYYNDKTSMNNTWNTKEEEHGDGKIGAPVECASPVSYAQRRHRFSLGINPELFSMQYVAPWMYII